MKKDQVLKIPPFANNAAADYQRKQANAAAIVGAFSDFLGVLLVIVTPFLCLLYIMGIDLF